MIPIFSPDVGEDELSEIRKVFASSWLGKGSQEASFKKGLAQRLGVDESHLCLSSSCTEFIFAFVRLFVPRDKTVLLPTISFPAVGSSIVENGNPYVLIDSDELGNVDLSGVARAMATGNVGAIFVTHYGGSAVDIPRLREIVGPDVLILEDAACALGGSVDGKAIGTLGDFACWSFDAMKLITVGDGGLGYCRDTEHARMLREYLYLGLAEREKSGLDKSKDGSGWWEYTVQGAGRRAIMNDISAAMGNVQLKKIDLFLQTRRGNVARLAAGLKGVGDIRIISEADPHSSAYYFTISTSKRDALAMYLKDKGVYSTFRYWPLHKMPVFAGDGAAQFPRADRIADEFLNIPCHHKLGAPELAKIIGAVRDFFESA